MGGWCSRSGLRKHHTGCRLSSLLGSGNGMVRARGLGIAVIGLVVGRIRSSSAARSSKDP